MSYYAKADGFVELDVENLKKDGIKTYFDLDLFVQRTNKDNLSLNLDIYEHKSAIMFSSYENYNEDIWFEFLNNISPYTKNGEIEFVGEDNARWRLVFNEELKLWKEESGTITYEGVYIVIYRANSQIYGVYPDIDNALSALKRENVDDYILMFSPCGSRKAPVIIKTKEKEEE